MKIGYARVSTLHQDLQSQKDLLNKEGCQVIYEDKFTGTQKDRPQFTDMLESLKTGDTLVVVSLDRLSRTAKGAIEVVEDLFKRDIKIHILNMGIVEDTPIGNVVFTIMSAFAQFERDMIVERTQRGLAIARQNPDFKEGRPKVYSDKQIDHAIELKKTHSYKQVTELTGMSKGTLYRATIKKKANTIAAETTQDQPIA